MNKKIPIFFFLIVYFNQGFFNLSGQTIYYLTRETWLLSASMLGLLGFITSLAWYSKPLFGFICDRTTNHKKLLTISYSSLLFLYLILIILPINIWILIIVLTLINCCIGANDVCNDKYMVKYEQSMKLNGRLQSLQWSALYVSAFIVSLLGAFIANKFEVQLAVKICYGIASIIPIVTLFYLKYKFKNLITDKSKPTAFKKTLLYFKNPKILFSLFFIVCFQLCPSFGNPLLIQMREHLHVSKMFIGYLDATSILFALLGYFLYYKIFYKYNLKKLLYFTVIFGAITNLFYLYIPTQWHIFGYNIAFGAFSGITSLTILAFFATLVPKGNEGMIYACITALSNLCAKTGSLFGGVIYDRFGYQITVIISTLFIMCCLFFIPKLLTKE